MLPRTPSTKRRVLELLVSADAMAEVTGSGVRWAVFESKKRFSTFYLMKVEWLDRHYFLVDATRDREARENISRLLGAELFERMLYGEPLPSGLVSGIMHTLMAYHLPIPEPLRRVVERAIDEEDDDGERVSVEDVIGPPV